MASASDHSDKFIKSYNIYAYRLDANLVRHDRNVRSELRANQIRVARELSHRGRL